MAISRDLPLFGILIILFTLKLVQSESNETEEKSESRFRDSKGNLRWFVVNKNTFRMITKT
jgi:hypothetical protein